MRETNDVEVHDVHAQTLELHAERDPRLRRSRAQERALRGQPVFVLPGGDRRVLSAVCPHEGCEVDWSGERREFLCPCHDSVFRADGARLSGPAQRGLDQLATRVNGDTLEMQYGDAQTSEPQTDAPTKG